MLNVAVYMLMLIYFIWKWRAQNKTNENSMAVQLKWFEKVAHNYYLQCSSALLISPPVNSLSSGI